MSRRFGELAFLLLAYFIAGKLGLRLAFVNASATAVWPATGIAVGGLLLLGRGAWPAIFIGAFLTNLLTAGTTFTSLGIAAGNTLEGVVAAYLIERLAQGRRFLLRPRDVFRFTGIAAAATTLSATLGVSTLMLGGLAAWTTIGPIWLTWWMGDMAGCLLVTPLIVSWAATSSGEWTKARAAEAFALSALAAATAFAVFGPALSISAGSSLEFLCFPTLLWAAYRFGPRATTLALASLSAVASLSTLHGFGPFAGKSPNEALLLLQAFMIVSAATMMSLSAVVAAHRRAVQDLRVIHRQLEERIDRRSAELAAIVETSLDAIIGTDAEANIRSWNSGAEQLLGYALEEVRGRSITLLAPPGREEEVARAFETARTGMSEYYETQRLCKNGDLVDVSIIISPVRDASGEIKGFSAIYRNIARRKRAERELGRKTEELMRSNSELSLFASIVSHELQEPLRKIIAFGDLLTQSDSATETQRAGYVKRMQDASRRMQRLIEDILDLSRVTTNARPVEPVDLGEVAEEVAADFKSRFEHVGARIETAALPVVLGDPFQVRQLFQNLIGNALKFRDKERPLVLRISELARADGFATFAFEDNGIGFEPEHAQRLFKPFQRLHRRGEFEGSGMGLAICQRILLRHGGAISARGELGRGATFEVTLPWSEKIAQAAAEALAAQGKSASPPA
ncbi:MAG: MASE1 domain-containing protein [Elusimicrobia bacterium]|nr:MASE1 domain-containing protein [Elusimicrobiota bacterium]